MAQGAEHWFGCALAQAAEAGIPNHLAKMFQIGEIASTRLTIQDLLE
jgi:hypothetical protein